MSCSDPSIIWPAPCFPAFLEPGDRHIELIACARNPDAGALRTWAERINLAGQSDGTALPASLDDVADAEPGMVDNLAGPFASSPLAAGMHFFRLRLGLRPSSACDSSRSVRLFDLKVGDDVVRPRSVALFLRHSTTLNLAFACDLHTAKLCDDISAAAERYFSGTAPAVPGPARLLDTFIDETNALAANGGLDLVVLGGDLVDHVHTRPRGLTGHGVSEETNVDRLMTSLARLEIPCIAIPGNHDHRSFPPRPRLTRLPAGLTRKQRVSVLKQAGMWNPLPLRLSDRDSLRTVNADGSTALGDHLARISPATDFCCLLRGLLLGFISTGRDILPRWREVEPARLGLLLSTLPTAMDHAESEGFSECQVARIHGWLQNCRGGAALFFHAPLLSPQHAGDGDTDTVDLNTGQQESMRDRIAFERLLRRYGLRTGASFRNPGPVLRELETAGGPVVTFSGHLHRATALQIDRSTMLGRSVELGRAAAGLDTFTMLTGPAIGLADPGNTHGPGYLLARFEKGRLTHLERRNLAIGSVRSST